MKTYEAPKVYTLGTVQELTAVDKCGGSGDQFLPQILSPNFDHPCPSPTP
jgi:hypothetical protein